MHFVSRIRGRRDVHVLTLDEFRTRAAKAKAALDAGKPDERWTHQEIFQGNKKVRAFYDYDAKLEVVPGDLDQAKTEHKNDFARVVGKLHPGAKVVYAQRHGWVQKAGERKYKISYRAFVVDVVMQVSDIPLHARKVLSESDLQFLDLTVYKEKEQLLGVIYGCKDIDEIKRYLVPLDEEVDPCEFLAQNVPDGAKEVTVREADTIGAKKRGRPKKTQSMEAPAKTMDGLPKRLSGADYVTGLQAATDFFGDKYRLRDKFTCFFVDAERKRLRLHPEEKWCFIRRGAHENNHQYITIDENHGARYSCHDEECQKAGAVRKDLTIAWTALPQEVRSAYHTAFPDVEEVIDAGLLEVAKTECQQNITDTWPNETGLDIRRQQAMFIACAKQQRCSKCETMLEFEQSVKGLRMRCECGAVWPPGGGHITVPEDRYPTMQQALLHLQMNIGVVVNGDVVTTINNYGTGGNGETFCGTYDNDGLVVFEDDEDTNRLFLAALQGTDADLSELVFALFKDAFHCGKAGAKGTDGVWYHFTEHHWVDKAELDLRSLLASDRYFLKYFRHAGQFYEQECIQTEESKKKARAIRRLLEQLRDGARRKRILDDAIVRFHNHRPHFAERLDTANMLVFTNGVMDLTRSEFRDGRPDDFLSVALDIPYQPMDQDSADCAYVMDFMKAIQPDERTRDYLLTLLSLCLTTDTSMQFFWIFTGAGANGKSKLMKLLTDTLREHAGAAPAALLTRRREDANQANEALSNLEKVRVAVFSEGSASEVIQVNTVKLFTGEDDISTRGLHEKQKRWAPMFKCILVCNEIPRLDESTWAGWRRFKIIPFPIKFVDNPRLPHERAKDPTVGTRLGKCRAAFASILIHYLQRFKTVGLPESDVIREATQMYQSENDVLEEFIDECLVHDPDAALVATEAVTAAMRWAKHRGRRLPDKKKAIMALFVEKFAESKIVYGRNHNGSVRGWKGYHLRESTPVESSGERLVRTYLEQRGIQFTPQHTFHDCRYRKELPFDFLVQIDGHQGCIEFQGRQHYEPVEDFGGQSAFRLQQVRDEIKRDYCFRNCIPLCIICYRDAERVPKILDAFLEQLRGDGLARICDVCDE
jgi:P4 family phage/plasmid primase-like protien